jgi:hypothetical protein
MVLTKAQIVEALCRRPERQPPSSGSGCELATNAKDDKAKPIRSVFEVCGQGGNDEM